MSELFENARKLGQQVLRSEESKNVADARAELERDETSEEKRNALNAAEKEFQYLLKRVLSIVTLTATGGNADSFQCEGGTSCRKNCGGLNE